MNDISHGTAGRGSAGPDRHAEGRANALVRTLPRGGERALWLTLGLGAIAGVAAVALIRQAGQNPVAHRPDDDAPGRTAKGFRTGRDVVAGRTVTINRPRGELYAFWRDFANLPQFMTNIASVKLDGDTARWTLKGPLGRELLLETTVTEERADERIAWRSTEGSQIAAEGSVTFRDAPAGRGTEVEALVAYDPRFGEAGRLVAKLFQIDPSIQGRRELKRFKMLMETGEIAVSSNQKSKD